MGKGNRQQVVSQREDLSRFVVHLTRDDQGDFTDGASARDNLLAILAKKTVLAVQPHCMFNAQLAQIPKAQRDRYNVACFTETPLNQLHLLIRPIEGRRIQLQPYGVVFTKDFIVKAGGQPAIYINSYEQNLWLRHGVDELFRVAKPATATDNDLLWRMLPFINSMHEGYDFSWEREWRVRGHLTFKLRDLVCIILPDQGEDDFKAKCVEVGIATISPGWHYERIVGELGAQQRLTRKRQKELALSVPATKAKADEAS